MMTNIILNSFAIALKMSFPADMLRGHNPSFGHSYRTREIFLPLVDRIVEPWMLLGIAAFSHDLR